jgi:hypothetical protein
MGAIQVLDRVGERGARHERGLAYTAVDAEDSFWTGGFPVHGTIEALLCRRCRRIVLYAVEHD